MIEGVTGVYSFGVYIKLDKKRAALNSFLFANFLNQSKRKLVFLVSESRNFCFLLTLLAAFFLEQLRFTSWPMMMNFCLLKLCPCC